MFNWDWNSSLWFVMIFMQFGFVMIAYRLFGRIGLFAYMGVSIFLLNLVSVVLVDYGFVGGWTLASGHMLFGSTFLITDILNENYGKREARKALWLGLFFAGAAMLIATGVTKYVPSIHDTMYEHFVALFGFASRIVFASFTAFLVSGLVDIHLYRYFREKNWGKIWISNNASTWFSKTIDAVVFASIAWYGIFPIEMVFGMMILSYFFDIITTILDTPFVYLGRWMKDNGKVGLLVGSFVYQDEQQAEIDRAVAAVHQPGK